MAPIVCDFNNDDNIDIENVEDMTQEEFENADVSEMTEDELGTFIFNYFDYHGDDIDELNLTKWNVSNIEYMNDLFSCCENVELLDITGWKTNKVKDMRCMFNGCRSLKEIKGLSTLDMHNVEDISWMFGGCESIEYLDISNWDLQNVKYADGLFNGCRSLKEIKGPSNVNFKDKIYYEDMIDDYLKDIIKIYE